MKKIDEPLQDPLALEQELNRIRYFRSLSRRNFIRNAGLASAAVAGASVLSACGSSSKVLAAGPSEADVLNFALNLEYLEAEFYLFATSGAGLSSADQGTNPSATTGGAKVNFANAQVADIAAEIALDEQHHVEFLRSALGSAAVAKPAINLAALGAVSTDAQFVNLARAFEDTGTSAYAGAATLLTGNNLQAAAQILATEALHTGNLRLVYIQLSIGTAGTVLDSLDKLPADPGAFFNTDQNGLAIKRTPSQVLAIVFHNSTPGTTSGGFFPNGVNGTINTV